MGEAFRRTNGMRAIMVWSRAKWGKVLHQRLIYGMSHYGCAQTRLVFIHGTGPFFWPGYKDRAGLYCSHTAGQYDLISNTRI